VNRCSKCKRVLPFTASICLYCWYNPRTDKKATKDEIDEENYDTNLQLEKLIESLKSNDIVAEES
jgi:hypothetical protein